MIHTQKLMNSILTKVIKLYLYEVSVSHKDLDKLNEDQLRITDTAFQIILV